MRRQGHFFAARIAAALLGIALSIAPSWTTAVHPQPATPEQQEQRAKELIVLVTGQFAGADTFGAGIIIGYNADRLYIVTANHIVQKGPTTATNLRVELKYLPGEAFEAKLLRHDANIDLAILMISDISAKHIPVKAMSLDRLGNVSALTRGAPVYSVGNPKGLSWASSLTPDRFDRIIGDRIVFESSFIREGHSGGGLFNERWELVGLILADQPPYGRAISMTDVLAALKDWSYPVGLSAAATATAPAAEGPAAAGASSLGRLAIISDRPEMVRTLLDFLQQQGAAASVTRVQDLPNVASSRPDVIMIGPDTHGVWTSMSKSIVRRLFENYRVIGMGEAGTELFSVLGLKLARVMSGGPAKVVVDAPALLHGPFPITAQDRTVEVTGQTPARIVGAYDEGSPAVAGFEGIAHWSMYQNHWPIARQGQYVLWGFPAVDQLTDSGKRLFANLLADHRIQPLVPLDQLTKAEYVKPGALTERLSAQFPTHKWDMQIRRPGRITARLSWGPPERPLALILNGPGKINAFARKDGVSPLTIQFDVKEDDVSYGPDWRISVTTFDKNLGGTVINYHLELSFPAD